MPLPRPVRRSSEGPEVVDHQPEKHFCRYSDIGERLRRGRVGNGTLSQKQLDPDEVETRSYPSPVLPPFPRLPRNIVPEFVERPRDRQRTCGLLMTIFLILAAFIIGGGIGGGVGGALVIKEKSRNAFDTPAICRRVEQWLISYYNSGTTCVTTTTPTVSAADAASTHIVIMDVAGCPSIIDVNFNSTTPGKSFHQLCYIDSMPPPGQIIDIGNQTISSFPGCLNACAKHAGCVAATWVMFSASNPQSNSVCFFKNSTGVQTSMSEGDNLASGYLI
ncbi:uncharacterized protein BP5553_06514 [Venustampulla echinocandica]|uniref:Apple domain-containing protein n=1 Tax=Venustampulla echinocandica TaxID=2656787 RepID=A0A370TK52_9HELO|nr:uncharacterized protein BP5553_06514 [Venustampulla echinocandica]RDL35902.1 hypothetical protein BP5553_06514 [Venustampulla echinocandica]